MTALGIGGGLEALRGSRNAAHGRGASILGRGPITGGRRLTHKDESTTNREEPAPTSFRDDCVVFNLRRATRIVTRRYDEALRPLGMTCFQFSALAALTHRTSWPQQAFAAFFGMDASTMNRNARAMERKGWITYAPDPQDKRKKHIAITADGRLAFEQAAPLWGRAQAETKALMTGFDWVHERAWLTAVSATPLEEAGAGA